MKRPLLVLALLAGILTTDRASVMASSTKFDEATYLLETWIESVIDFDRLPGVSISVVHDQELVYAKGFGYADLQRGLKTTPDTYYSICSISKLFTAIAVMQLRDAGKLSLDDPVSKHIPWFAPELPDSVSPPTIQDLLAHIGGLPCEPDWTVWSEVDSLFPSREALIDRVSNLKMSYLPGSRFNYSNLGYSLLGEVVSVVSGMEYEEYIRKSILDPLGLKATLPFLPLDLLGTEMAAGYSPWPRKGSRYPVRSHDERAMTPAAGFASTARDLAVFAKWQFRALDGEDDRILRRETLEEMQTAHWPEPKWGLGFSIWYLGDLDIVGHQGGCYGYQSLIILCPEEKIAVVVMINATDAPQFTLAFTAYRILAPALRDPAAHERKPRECAEYVGSYTAIKSWSEAEVLEWDGRLSVLWVPAHDPMGSLVRLEHIEGNLFRQVERDGSLGKHYAFGADEEGKITSMRFNNNLLRRMLP